jgi:hypothetical protein
MKFGLFSICALLACGSAFAQDQNAAPQQPPVPEQTPPAEQAPAPNQQPNAKLRPPRETLSPVNTGRGFSIEPVYWFSRQDPQLRTGSLNANPLTGDFDFPKATNRTIGAMVSIPAGKNAVIRGSYFQTQSTGQSSSPVDANLVGQTINANDFLATRIRLEDFKLSYDYVTYFWKRENSELRLLTLWGAQRVSVTNEINDFVPNSDGTFSVNTALGSKAVFYPTFGLGIEHTMSQHLRWEARASGFTWLHGGTIGDLEASAAYRVSHFELLAGARMLHYKTTTNAEEYNRGTLWGPYVGLRYYWSKK